MDLGRLGKRVELNLTDGERVNGWLYGKTLVGTYVSLDKRGKHIRFIKDEQIKGQSISERDKADFALDKAANFEKLIYTLNSDLLGPLETALSNADHNVLYYTVERSKQLQDMASNIQGEERYRDFAYSRTGVSKEILERHAARADDAMELYEQLHRELDRNGILQLLEDNSNHIIALPYDYVMPEIDYASTALRQTIATEKFGESFHKDRPLEESKKLLRRFRLRIKVLEGEMQKVAEAFGMRQLPVLKGTRLTDLE